MRDAPFHRAGRRVTAAVDHPLRKHMHPCTCARTGNAVLFRLGSILQLWQVHGGARDGANNCRRPPAHSCATDCASLVAAAVDHRCLLRYLAQAWWQRHVSRAAEARRAPTLCGTRAAPAADTDAHCAQSRSAYVLSERTRSAVWCGVVRCGAAQLSNQSQSTK
jgi:hypothetical protein